MKKFLSLSFATLGVVLFVLAASRAQAADLKLNGDFRVRAFYLDDVNDRNEDADDREAFADQRFRLKTELSSGDVGGIIVVDFTNSAAGVEQAVFQNPTTAGGPTGNTRFGTVGFGRSFNVIGIRQAYLRVKFPAFGFAAGRKPFKLGHGLVLDDTADAIAVRLGPQLFNLTLADIKLLDTDAVPPGLGLPTGTGSDADLYVAKINFMHEDQHNVGVFVTYLNDRGPGLAVTGLAAVAGLDKTTLTTVGVTADGKFGPVKLDVELDWLTGEREAITGTGTDLSGLNLLIGAGLGEMLPFGVSATLLIASGDDVTDTDGNVNGLSPNFVFGNILVNRDHDSDRDGGNVGCPISGMSCAGLQALKVSGMVGGVPMMPNSSLEAALIWAQTAEDPCGGTTVPCPAGVSSSKDLGWEFDLNAKAALTDTASIFATFGYLVAGDAFKAVGGSTADDNPIKVLIGLSYNF